MADLVASASTARLITLAGGSFWGEPGVIAAAVAGAVALLTLSLNGRRGRIDRQRELFGQAFAAVMAYREFPYVVLRRDRRDPAGELVRISSELSHVQQQLNTFAARLEVEDPRVGARYADLVRATRSIVGSMIHQAWETPPASVDEAAHAPSWINSDQLAHHDGPYLQAVRDHLSVWWTPARRAFRRVTALGGASQSANKERADRGAPPG